MRSLYLLTGGLIISAIIGGCTSDETKQLPTLVNKTFTGKTLKVYYCGEESPAKSAVFSPSNSSENGSIIISGLFDLSSLGITGINPLPAPGPLPGTEELNLNVALIPTAEGYYSFTGHDITEYLSYNYTGKVYADSLIISFDNVTLTNDAYAGKVFSPMPLKASMTDIADDIKNDKDIQSPFYIRWEVGNLPNLKLHPGVLLNALTIVPIIPVYHNTAYASVASLFCQSVQTMAFLDNGNIPVRYYSSKEGATQLMTTSPNMLQYVPTGANTLQVYLNPLSAVGLWLVNQSVPTWLPSFFDTDYADKIKDEISQTTPTETEEQKELKEALTKALLTAISPSLRSGIPFTMDMTGDNTKIYLDTKTCVLFITSLLAQIEEQPTIQKYLAEILTQTGLTSEEIQQLMTALPSLLEATTSVNIGLNLR